MANESTKTVIGEDVEIVGSIKAAAPVQLDGKLNGDLNCQANCVVGKSAKVKGNINVESVSIEGQISGNVTAKDRIEMKSTANVTGDIRSKRLTVEDGVTFVGKSEVNPSGAPANRPAGDERPSEPSAATSQSETGGAGRKS